MGGKQAEVLFFRKGLVGIHRGLEVEQAAVCRLLFPFLRIAVSVENNAAMGGQRILDELCYSSIKILCLLQYVRKLTEGFCHSGIEHDIGHCHVLRGAGHTELKLVACKGKGRGAVAVGGILGKGGDRRNSQIHLGAVMPLVGSTADDGIHHLLQIVADEHGNDGGGCLICPQSVIIPRKSDGKAQQILIIVHCLDNSGKDQQKLLIFRRRFTGLEQIFAPVGADRPVVVLARAGNTRIGLFL